MSVKDEETMPWIESGLNQPKKIVANMEPMEGCIVLGQDNPDNKVYVTRYHIQHSRQRDMLCEEVLFEDCLPFLDVHKMTSRWRGSWAFIGSQIVLFLLHGLSLVLGVVKVADPVAADNVLACTVFETILACVYVIICTCDAWLKYEDIKDTIYKLEHVLEKRVVKGWASKIWLITFTFSSMCLLAFAMGMFVWLHYAAHLGWTVLTNQFIIIIVVATSSLFKNRVYVSLRKIREDQHKAVVWEAILLMREGHFAKSEENKKLYRERVDAFTDALRFTPIFEKALYIDVHEAFKNELNTLLDMNASST